MIFFKRRALPFLGDQFVCDIPLREGTMAHMRLDGELSADKAVVICNPDRFLSMWKLSGRRPEVLACEGDWTRDYKFTEAAKGFSHGADNPVPLADVVFRWDITSLRYLTSRLGEWRETFEAWPVLDFGNGITRTIWLLHNGARYFPVECHRDEAPAFHRAIGIGPNYLTRENFPQG
jgi:hypothetical protein